MSLFLLVACLSPPCEAPESALRWAQANPDIKAPEAHLAMCGEGTHSWARRVVQDPGAPVDEVVLALAVLGEVADPRDLASVLKRAASDEPAVRAAGTKALIEAPLGWDIGTHPDAVVNIASNTQDVWELNRLIAAMRAAPPTPSGMATASAVMDGADPRLLEQLAPEDLGALRALAGK